MIKRIFLFLIILQSIIIVKAQETIWTLENQYMINYNNSLQSSSDGMLVDNRSTFNWGDQPAVLPGNTVSNWSRVTNIGNVSNVYLIGRNVVWDEYVINDNSVGSTTVAATPFNMGGIKLPVYGTINMDGAVTVNCRGCTTTASPDIPIIKIVKESDSSILSPLKTAIQNAFKRMYTNQCIITFKLINKINNLSDSAANNYLTNLQTLSSNLHTTVGTDTDSSNLSSIISNAGFQNFSEFRAMGDSLIAASNKFDQLTAFRSLSPEKQSDLLNSQFNACTDCITILNTTASNAAAPVDPCRDRAGYNACVTFSIAHGAQTAKICFGNAETCFLCAAVCGVWGGVVAAAGIIACHGVYCGPK